MLLPVLTFACVGLLLIGYAVISTLFIRRSRTWVRVEGQIQSSDIEEVEVIAAHYSLWRPSVHYSYGVGGQIKTGSKLTLDKLSHRFTSKSDVQKFLAQYPNHAAVPIYVSASGDAVLLSDIDRPRKSHYFTVGSAGGLILILGLALGFIF